VASLSPNVSLYLSHKHARARKMEFAVIRCEERPS